jgi:outer membrane protein assembly factor BamD
MKYIAFSLIILWIIGCSRKSPEVELGPEEEFKLAMKWFKKKDYNKAINRFKRVVFRYPGSKWTEEAQYRLGNCHFLQKDYASAEIEYEFFIQSYPRSRFTDNATFELAVCCFKQSAPYYLDQATTKKAYQKFQSFIRKYPESEFVDEAKEYVQKCIDKFVRKDLESAKLYKKMGKIESAILYLKDIQEKYPETSYKEEVAELLKECEKIINP